MSAGPSSNSAAYCSSTRSGSAGPHRSSSNFQKTRSNNNPGHMPGTPEPFTPEMRDRQARGKDPYYQSDDGSDGGDLSVLERFGSSGRQEKEPFEKVEARMKAEAILDRPELLMMHAQMTGSTIPATRYKLMRIMCGFDDEGDEEEYEESPDQEPQMAFSRRRGDRSASGRL